MCFLSFLWDIVPSGFYNETLLSVTSALATLHCIDDSLKLRKWSSISPLLFIQIKLLFHYPSEQGVKMDLKFTAVRFFGTTLHSKQHVHSTFKNPSVIQYFEWRKSCTTFHVESHGNSVSHICPIVLLSYLSLFIESHGHNVHSHSTPVNRHVIITRQVRHKTINTTGGSYISNETVAKGHNPEGGKQLLAFPCWRGVIGLGRGVLWSNSSLFC